VEACVEAGINEWFWFAPLGQDKAVAAVFVDPQRLPKSRKIDSIYHQLLSSFELFPNRKLEGVVGEVKACDATSRHSEDPVGVDFIKVGDANLTLDPLSSQGVQSAIASGLQAAVIVNTLLKSPENKTLAIDFYRARQKEKMNQHAAKTAEFYRQRSVVCDQPFWRQRAGTVDSPAPIVREPIAPIVSHTGAQIVSDLRAPIDTDRVQLSHAVKIISTPVLGDDLVISLPTLHHDALERPVAFVGGVEIAPLLSRILPGQTIQTVVKTWSQQLPIELCYGIVEWLWSRRILVPVESGDMTMPGFEPALNGQVALIN
jgi:hypothetical protein